MYIEPTIRKQQRIEVNDRISVLFEAGNLLQHGIFRYGWRTGGQKVRRCLAPDGQVLIGWTPRPEDDLMFDLPDASVHCPSY